MNKKLVVSVVTIIATLGVLFQIGHFTEHAVQFGEWVFGDRTKPWMSGIAMWLADTAGSLFSSGICTSGSRQMAVGMEVLHLVGNSIFLITIGALYYLIPNKWIKYALYVEGFHLCEHLMLTFSVIYLGKPIGFSTMFGYSKDFFSHDNAVGYRVGWHFIMNLIPSALMMIGMKEIFSKK